MFELKNIKFKNILDIEYLKIEGSITCIVGTSGSGKTTLLRLLNKLYVADSGEIIYNTRNLKDEDAVSLRREVVMLNQMPIVYDGTLRDNLQIGLVLSNKEKVSDIELVSILREVGLDKKLDSSCQMYSGGEKQRLCLARVLLMNADVYLLDEPSSALDNDTEMFIINCLSDFVLKKNKQLIIVTHSNQVSSLFEEHCIRIDSGRLVDSNE